MVDSDQGWAFHYSLQWVIMFDGLLSVRCTRRKSGTEETVARDLVLGYTR